MPPPVVVGVYVVAAVGTAAAVVAFKEFVYEPHIAPRVEKWAEEFLAKRRAKKNKMKGKAAEAVPILSASAQLGDTASVDNRSTYELESLVENEVTQWRRQVDLSRESVGTSTLRLRKSTRHVSGDPGTPLDESNIIIPYDPITPTPRTPTHILFDPTDGLSAVSASPTSTSTLSSRVATPAVLGSPSPHSSLSDSYAAFRTPPPPAVQAPPTPEPSVRGARSPPPQAPSPPVVFPALLSLERNPFDGGFPSVDADAEMGSPPVVASLSLSHPFEHDVDLELLSASSSPASRFSEFSHLGTGTGTEQEQFHSFASVSSSSPRLRVLSASSSEAGDADDLDHWSNAGSEISGTSWASAGGH